MATCCLFQLRCTTLSKVLQMASMLCTTYEFRALHRHCRLRLCHSSPKRIGTRPPEPKAKEGSSSKKVKEPAAAEKPRAKASPGKAK